MNTRGLRVADWSGLSLAVGLSLVHAHGRALQTAEQNRALLEARVAEISAEVERNFEQLAELRVEQVTQRERKRICWWVCIGLFLRWSRRVGAKLTASTSIGEF